VYLFAPGTQALLDEGVGYFRGTLGSGIAETVSLVGGPLGPITGPLSLFGVVLFLALPYLVWATVAIVRDHRPAWLVLVVYAWYFLLASLLQRRFAGELAPFLAPFAAVAVLDVATRVGVLADAGVPFAVDTGESKATDATGSRWPTVVPSAPTRSVLAVGVVVILLVTISFVQIPIRVNQVAVDDERYETAQWLSTHGEVSPEVEEAVVFSRWDQNYMYNYFAAGWAESYWYAREYYSTFAGSSESEEWAERLRDAGIEYVVTHDEGGDYWDQALQTRLHDHLGSRNGDSPGVGQYRVRYVSDDGGVKVFGLVPGARIVGTGPVDGNVTVTANVTAADRSMTYRRVVETNPYGLYTVTVPYAGNYTVSGGSVGVSKSDVTEAHRIRTHEREGVAHWPFDTGPGEIAHDRVGGYPGTVEGATWVDGVNGSALSFDGVDDRVQIEDAAPTLAEDESLTVAFWLKGNLSAADARYPTVFDGTGNSSRIGFWARSNADDFGVRIDDRSGADVRNFGVNRTTFEEWTHITAVLDRSSDELRLYADGRLVRQVDASGLGSVKTTGSLSLGAGVRGDFAPVVFDDVRIFDRALTTEEVDRISSRPAQSPNSTRAQIGQPAESSEDRTMDSDSA
jgi:dolichyl-diphosphooligosaccharide--protein glycosyltransferase